MLKQRIILVLLVVCSFPFAFREGLAASEFSKEKIVYTISPFGIAEYNDLGSVELDGKTLNLVTFKTQVLGFKDTERIYSLAGNLSPVKVEREVIWMGKEYLEETYDPKNFSLKIGKFKSKKKVKEYLIKSDGPIYNAILLFFYLRHIPQVDIGWTFEVRVPAKFQIKLDKIEEVTIPMGKFLAYHFSSVPDKFELWISKDKPHTPLKIKGKAGLGYTLVLKEHTFGQPKTPAK